MLICLVKNEVNFALWHVKPTRHVEKYLFHEILGYISLLQEKYVLCILHMLLRKKMLFCKNVLYVIIRCSFAMDISSCFEITRCVREITRCNVKFHEIAFAL